jgi:hypothetical protein
MVDIFYKPAHLHCGLVAVRKIQDGGLECAAHFVLRSYLLRRSPAPLLSSNYVSAYGRQEILDEL